MKVRIAILVLLCVTGCRPAYYNGVPVVHFCDLPRTEGTKVCTEAIFSGIDEYWALNGPGGCRNGINVELDYYQNGKEIPGRFRPLFDSAYGQYWNTSLKVILIGVYDSKAGHYGHLGSNRARFIVTEFVEVEVLKKE